MRARRLRQWAVLAAAGSLFAGIVLLDGAYGQDSTGAGGALSGYCNTTPDPNACQQLLNSAISQGLVPQGLGTGGQLSLPGQSGGEINGIAPGPQPSVTVTPTPPQSKRPREHSHLEDIYSQRAGKPLEQFGYDVIGNGGTISALQIGAIQDDYILGQGDAIVVTLRGQENATYSVFVDRDGNVTLPRLRPISAVGRRFGDFRDELSSAIKQGYLQTQSYITMGQVRQISVNVVGEVTNPGVYALSGLSSVLDALNVAGGIRKSGSLRKISIDRNGKAIEMDLYKFLSPDGFAPNITLRQGDRIIVAPLGATIAVSGDVRRAGIYELPPGAREASARSMLSFANGYAIRGKYRLTILKTRPDGTQEYVDSTAHPGAVLRDGEMLVVDAAASYAGGNITLEGNVRLPGVYAVNRTPTLRALLPSPQSFLPMTYMPFGFIVREDPRSLRRSVVPFSVESLLEGKYNTPLQSQDAVHILTFNAMRQLVDLRNGTAMPQPNQQNAVCNTPTQLPAGFSASTNGSAGNLTPTTGNLTPATGNLPCPPAGVPPATDQSASNSTTTALAQLFQRAGMTMPSGAGGALPMRANTTSATASLSPGATNTLSANMSSANTLNANTSSAAGTQASSAGATTSGTASTDSGVEGLTPDEVATVGVVVADYRVSIDGAVRQPGDYLAVPGVPLDQVVDAANGLAPDADLNAVEITSVAIDNVGGLSSTTRKMYALSPERLASVSLQRFDVVHIPPVPSDQEQGSVQIAGEVQFPGTYHLLKGERLSSVLQRAGGLTKQAYPLGAVFQRTSIASVRQTAYQREADDLQKQLMASVAQAGTALAASSGSDKGLSADAAVFVANVIQQLRTKTADGRMSILADPAALAANPQADIELQAGDQLLIPKRPSEVDVTGEVLNAGSFRFSPKMDVADYIGLAGGYDRYADEDHIFVVDPDGTSRRVSDDLFDFQSGKLAPGSVIVVPRDLRPLDLGLLTVTVTKIMSDLAISAASLAVISKSN